MLRLGAVGARHGASYDSTTVGHGIMPLRSHARGKLNIDTLHFFLLVRLIPLFYRPCLRPSLKSEGIKEIPKILRFLI